MSINNHLLQPYTNMLIIVALSFTLYEGTYKVKRISAQDTAKLIRENSKELVSAVSFESTAKVLSKMTGITIECEAKPTVPPPYFGDKILSVRLKDGVSRRAVAESLHMDDLDFLLIDYSV